MHFVLIYRFLGWFKRLLFLSGFLPLLHEVELLLDEVEHIDAFDCLVGRVALPDQVRVIKEEEEQHNRHDTAEEDRDGEHLVFRLQILHDHPDICSKLLALLIVKDFRPQILLVDQMLCAQNSHDQTIYADTTVEEKEQDKVLVVVKTDAIVDPDAMMVEFLDADVAESAML